jgi:MFS superfamily sulfate permease-like transporter
MTDTNDVLNIKFKPSLTLHNVSEFYEELFEAKDREVNKLVFDCSINEEIDFSAIQALAAFYQHMADKGIKIAWDNPSIVLFERTVELGMDEALGL